MCCFSHQTGVQAHYLKIPCTSGQAVQCSNANDALKLLSPQTTQTYMAALLSVSQPPTPEIRIFLYLYLLPMTKLNL